MTWHETHERTRIIREVEAHAAISLDGTLPWKDSWAPYFADPAGLVIALRSRWQRMCEAQLDTHSSEQAFQDAHGRLRRSNAGILRILERHDADKNQLRTVS